MEVFRVLVVILAFFLHRVNGRATDFDKIMRRIQDGGVPSTQGAVPWRSKRSPGAEPSCYTGRVVSFTLPSSKTVTSPICKKITSSGTACFSSMANNNNQRKCVPSNFITEEGKRYNTACSCAP
ncbi:hypothetical protein pdam_00007107 [Pocillopora damicornis]|uniref:SUEL-type lectin domain-containing protein n=1 Tax=Pocillopora damicornis TaxID=46731 RepID=A0A3M6TEG9_POCDA|nr:uncharacterized protein LOC113678670 [Pocillopora damicornis]RMX39780.1 hypothetical protein pdam_00007107 [Pocillopora damicornis]